MGLWPKTTNLQNQKDVTNLVTGAITSTNVAVTNNTTQINELSITGCQNVNFNNFTQTNTSTISSTAFTTQAAQQQANQNILQTIVNTASAQGQTFQLSDTAVQLIQNIQTAITDNMDTTAYTNISNAITEINKINISDCKITNNKTNSEVNFVDTSQSNNAEAVSLAIGNNKAVQQVVQAVTNSFKNTTSATTESKIWLIVIAICITVCVVAVVILGMSLAVGADAAAILETVLPYATVFGFAMIIALSLLIFLYYRSVQKTKEAGAQWQMPSCKTNTDCSKNTLIASDKSTVLATSCQNGFCNPLPCTADSDCTKTIPNSTCFTGSNPGYCTAAPAPS